MITAEEVKKVSTSSHAVISLSALRRRGASEYDERMAPISTL